MSTIRISQGVGIRQPNKYRDVKTVQSLLNANSVITTPGNELKVDGYIGEKTIAKIKDFQEKLSSLIIPMALFHLMGRLCGDYMEILHLQKILKLI